MLGPGQRPGNPAIQLSNRGTLRREKLAGIEPGKFLLMPAAATAAAAAIDERVVAGREAAFNPFSTRASRASCDTYSAEISAAARVAASSPENITGRTVAALPTSTAAPGSMDGSDGIRPSLSIAVMFVSAAKSTSAKRKYTMPPTTLSVILAPPRSPGPRPIMGEKLMLVTS